ncbi:MAG: type II toxin-antitoxin system VapB family antitoxin [Brevundimonas sp.]
MRHPSRHDTLKLVTSAPVQIRKAETVELLRRLAALEGKTITELVDEMARERDRRFETQRTADIDRRRRAVGEIVAHFNSLPIVGPLLTDDDLYDEHGLPK